MLFLVTTCALDLTDPTAPTLQPFKGGGTTNTRTIDTDTNELFRGMTTEWQIADMVEAFWNRLNDRDEAAPANCSHQTDRVVVTNVVKVN